MLDFLTPSATVVSLIGGIGLTSVFVVFATAMRRFENKN